MGLWYALGLVFLVTLFVTIYLGVSGKLLRIEEEERT